MTRESRKRGRSKRNAGRGRVSAPGVQSSLSNVHLDFLLASFFFQSGLLCTKTPIQSLSRLCFVVGTQRSGAKNRRVACLGGLCVKRIGAFGGPVTVMNMWRGESRSSPSTATHRWLPTITTKHHRSTTHTNTCSSVMRYCGLRSRITIGLRACR